MSRLILLAPLLALLLTACDTATPDPLPTLASVENEITPTPAAAGAGGGTLEFWQMATGELAVGAPDIWTFEGQRGDQVTVRLVSRGAEAALTLETIDDRLLGEGTTVEAVLPEDGTFTVTAALLPDGAPGAYEIGLSYTDQTPPDAIAPSEVPVVVGVPTPVPVYAELGTFISSVTDGELVSGTLRPGQDSHIYTFDGGSYAQIEVRRVSGDIDPRLTLYDPEGVPIATDGDSGGTNVAILRNIQLADEGLYNIEIAGGEGAYTLQLWRGEEPAPLPVTVLPEVSATPFPTLTAAVPRMTTTGTQLEDHVPVAESLTQPGDVDIYPISAGAGEIFTVGVSPVSSTSLRPEIEISGPEGSIVAAAQASTSNAGGTALIVNHLAALEGTYRVYVRGEADTFGPYTISYGRGSTYTNILRGETVFDAVQNGTLEQRGHRDLWMVALSAGDVITATVNPAPGSRLDPLLDLVRAGEPETVIALDDNGAGGFSPLLRDVRIEQSGLYLLRVKASQGRSTGAYNLIWRYVNRAPTPTPQPALSPVMEINDIVPENTYQFYPFQGRAGQRVQIHVQAMDSTFDPVAVLLDVEGGTLAQGDDDEGLNPFFSVTLPADGTYTLRVNGYLSAGAFQARVDELVE